MVVLLERGTGLNAVLIDRNGSYHGVYRPHAGPYSVQVSKTIKLWWLTDDIGKIQTSYVDISTLIYHWDFAIAV